MTNVVHQTQGEELGEQRGLMLLTGDLRDFHLPDLIKLISSGKHTGTLTVTDGTFTRTLSVHEGRPVCATSSRFDGEIPDPDQVMDDLYDLFRWQEGAFTFDQRTEPSEGCTVLGISAENLILAGSRWVDNWTTIQRVVPSPDTVFERREGGAADLDLTEDECQVLSALDGLKDVTTVARECGLTEFEISKILYGFHAVGLVQPGDQDKIRLRRLFREFAELMCRGIRPYRASPDDTACEMAVNERRADLPVRLITGRIEDHTDPALRTDELAKVYRDFLKNRRVVVKGWFGEEVAEHLFQRVLAQISPGLRDALERYDLV